MVELAIQAGLAVCSIEDFSGNEDAPIYALEPAQARVEAAAQAAHRGPSTLVLTARAENHLPVATTWTTQSPACGPTRRPAPTCSMRPGCAPQRTSLASSTRLADR